jgi:flagellar hook-associated protein 1 FlgK
MGLRNLYEMSRRSFTVFSAQMNTAGQNIANVNTPGYARRRLQLEPADPMTTGILMRRGANGAIGGVSIESFERMHDSLLASASWEAQAGLGGADEEARLLGALEGVFGVGSGASLTDVMDGFWNAWSDVANNPTDVGTRNALISQTETVTATLNGLDENINRLATQTESALAGGVKQANGLLEELAELNATVRSARASGSPDLAAEDRRDAAVAELAAFAPVKVSDDPDGYHITVSGMSVLQGDEPTLFRYEPPTGTNPAAVRFGSTDVTVPSSADGTLGAQVRTLNETLPDTVAALDSFAAKLVTDVNTQHATGFGLDGVDARNFFDPAELEAGSIRISDIVRGDPSVIAAAGPDAAAPGVFPGPGDSNGANAIAGMREGFDTDSAAILSDVGAKLRGARTAAGAHAAVADHLAAMEQAVSGVSMDEEMTKLLEAQHAFAASARVLNTAEEMMQTILAL